MIEPKKMPMHIEPPATTPDVAAAILDVVRRRPLDIQGPWGIQYGAGVDSTAVISALASWGMVPDWWIWADTGSEMPETYEVVRRARVVAKTLGWPDLTVVRWTRRDGRFIPIHEYALARKELPSKAYGYSGCTMKWKIQPAMRWRKAHGKVDDTVVIGYNACEVKRKEKGRDLEKKVYPLIHAGVGRDEAQILADALLGMHVPKSSCFCCPMRTKAEWSKMIETHPSLVQTSLVMEQQAYDSGKATTSKTGLCSRRSLIRWMEGR